MAKLVWAKNTSLKVADGKLVPCSKGSALPEDVIQMWGEAGIASAIKGKLVIDVSDVEKAREVKEQVAKEAAKKALAADQAKKAKKGKGK